MEEGEKVTKIPFITKHRRIIFGVLIIIFFGFFCGVLTLSIFDVFNITEDQSYEKGGEYLDQDVNTYQILRIDETSMEESVGIVSLRKEIESSTFMEEEGYTYLISKLGEKEFKCTGSCYCRDSDNQERRSTTTSTTVRKGVMFLVAAVSSVFAHTKAKEYFDHYCLEELSESDEGEQKRKKCDLYDIYADVEECEEVYKIEKNIYKGERTYQCDGFCVKRSFYQAEKHQFLSQRFPCEELKNEGDLYFKCFVTDDNECMELAKVMFQRAFLVDFCMDNSHGTLKVRNREGFLEEYSTHFCQARRKNELNPTVRCQQLYP